MGALGLHTLSIYRVSKGMGRVYRESTHTQCAVSVGCGKFLAREWCMLSPVSPRLSRCRSLALTTHRRTPRARHTRPYARDRQGIRRAGCLCVSLGMTLCGGPLCRVSCPAEAGHKALSVSKRGARLVNISLNIKIYTCDCDLGSNGEGTRGRRVWHTCGYAHAAPCRCRCPVP